MEPSFLHTEEWLNGAVYTDSVNETVERLTVQWCAAFFTPAIQPCFSYASSLFAREVGVEPTCTKHTLKSFKTQHDALKAALSGATQELSRQFCMNDFDADASYMTSHARLGYLLKYTVYNACLSAVIMTRIAPLLLGNTEPNKTLSIACYGGGPGTDLLAVKTFLQNLHCTAAHARVFDLACWGSAWGEQSSLIESTPEEHVQFHALDILAEESRNAPFGVEEDGEGVPRAPQLITFFYTANEMANEAEKRGKFKAFFRAMCLRLPQEARVLLLDRTRAHIISLIEEIAEENADILRAALLSVRIEPELPKQIINKVCDYTARFGVKPRLGGKAGVTVFIRK